MEQQQQQQQHENRVCTETQAAARQRHVRLLVRRLAAAGMSAKTDAAVQRCLQLEAQQQQLVLDMQEGLIEGQNLGSLSVLPREVLQQLLGSLGGRDVRSSSRALCDTFDSCNKRLVLWSGLKFRLTRDAKDPPEDLPRLVGDLVLRSPQLRELRFTHGCRLKLSEVLAAGGLGGRLQVLELSDSHRGLEDGPNADSPDTLARTLRSLTVLTTLRGEGSYGAVVMAALPALHGLKTLHLSVQDIRVGRDVALPQGLLALTALEDLELGVNAALPADCAACLATALARLTTLRSLDVRGVDVQAALAPALRALAGLQTLRLGYVDADAAAAMANGLPAQTALTDLNMSLGEASQAGAAALFPRLKAQTGLRKLQLSTVGSGVAKLLPVLEALTGLQELQLGSCGIDATATADLGSVLASLPALTELDLQSNHIGAAGAAEVCAALAAPARLQRLGLNNICVCVGDSRTFLASKLQLLTSLRHLSLKANGLDPCDARALAPALAALPLLEELDLGTNHLGTSGIAVLAPAFWRLRHLSLRCNDLFFGSIEVVAAAVEGLPRLLKLDLLLNVGLPPEGRIRSLLGLQPQCEVWAT